MPPPDISKIRLWRRVIVHAQGVAEEAFAARQDSDGLSANGYIRRRPRRRRIPGYYSLMLAALMTFLYFASSDCMSLESSAGVVVRGSAPLRSNCSFISGVLAIVVSSP
jgi:hypothetical protein